MCYVQPYVVVSTDVDVNFSDTCAMCGLMNTTFNTSDKYRCNVDCCAVRMNV